MPIESIAAAAAVSGFTPLTALADTATTSAAAGTAGAGGANGFGDAIVGALDDLSAAHNNVDVLATKAATGQLPDVHDYTIAAAEASLSTELTVAVRNKAIAAFQSIMNMPL
jgi:flagellar hook-basal body complex protein FliE